MMWSSFRNEHGKGPHDGVWVVIKCIICCEQLNANGTKLQNVAKVINFLHGAILHKCIKDYVECSKILHPLNFEKLLHEFEALEFNVINCIIFLYLYIFNTIRFV
jgi:hypothetical protein